MEDKLESLDIFGDKVNSRATELVAYIRRFFQAHVDDYNKKLKPGEPPKCAMCETEEFLEGLVETMVGATHLGNEIHDSYHEILNQKYGFKLEDGDI